MQEPPLPVNEASRISSLVKLDVLDTPPEERFDRITRLARRVFDVPISMISLVDKRRQWFKSKQGLGVSETCRKSSFCAHAIAMPETSHSQHRIMEVADTSLDPRFSGGSLVVGEPHIRFYAGFVLQSHDDYNLGTLCIIDNKPRYLSDEDRNILFDIGMIAQDSLQSLRYEDKDIHTGLYNRRGFFSVVEYALEETAKQRLHASLIYIEKQNCLSIVNEHGCMTKRETLVNFVEILKSTFRSSDVISRIGENQFVVLTTHNPSFEIDRVLIQLKEKMQLANENKDNNFRALYKIGSVSFASEYVKSSGKLIDLVDKRMNESQYSEVYSLLS